MQAGTGNTSIQRLLNLHQLKFNWEFYNLWHSKKSYTWHWIKCCKRLLQRCGNAFGFCSL